VQQQFGMIVGIRTAIRSTPGDAQHPRRAFGHLPRRFRPASRRRAAAAGAPPVCEIFRHLPDALEQAAALDAQYGRNPDLEKMPMYGVVFSFKDPFDTKDMRSTGGGDAATTSTFRRATTCWSSSCARRARSSSPRRSTPSTTAAPAIPAAAQAGQGAALDARLSAQHLGRQPGQSYDTTRAASLGSSSGSGVSVSANLVMASLGEETRASCRGPSNHNAVALILPHKAMLGFDGGAIGADIYCDRSGIHAPHARRLRQDSRRAEGPRRRLLRSARSVHDRAALVGAGDALCEPRAHQLGRRARSRGMRLGVIRESMVYPEGSKTEEPIVTAAAGDQVGARRASRRDAGGIVRSAAGRPIPRSSR
jgi:amidase